MLAGGAIDADEGGGVLDEVAAACKTVKALLLEAA